MPVMISISVAIAWQGGLPSRLLELFLTSMDSTAVAVTNPRFRVHSGQRKRDDGHRLCDDASVRCDEHWEPRCGTRAQPPARFAPSDSSACGLLLFATAVPVVSYSSLPQEEGLRVSATNHRQALQSMINGCRGRPFSTESFVGLEELIIY
jgi:hypothetical protein